MLAAALSDSGMLDLLAVPLICLLGGAAVFWQFKSLLLGLEALAASRQEGVLATVQPYVAAVSRGIKTIVGSARSLKMSSSVLVVMALLMAIVIVGAAVRSKLDEVAKAARSRPSKDD